MQAIQTKALPPTNTQGARIKASCRAGTITIPYPDFDEETSHIIAADSLCVKLATECAKLYGGKMEEQVWLSVPRVAGCLQNGMYAHVFNAWEGGAK